MTQRTEDRVIITLASGHGGGALQVELASRLRGLNQDARHLFVDKDGDKVGAVEKSLGTFLDAGSFKALKFTVGVAQETEFLNKAKRLGLSHINTSTEQADNPAAIRLLFHVNRDKLKNAILALLPKDERSYFTAMSWAVVLWAPSGPTSSVFALEAVPEALKLVRDELDVNPRGNRGIIEVISVPVHPPDPTIGQSLRKINTSHAVRANQRLESFYSLGAKPPIREASDDEGKPSDSIGRTGPAPEPARTGPNGEGPGQS